jgi:Dolichyl-phosphate-mannose-protein mannosyltransferase
MSKKISIKILIFLFFFSIYTITMIGQLHFGDEAERYLSAQSIAERHDLAIQFDQDLHRHIALDGRNYSLYELGSIVPLVPFYALGNIVSRLFPNGDTNGIELLVTGLANPVLTALTCVVLFEFGTALGYPTTIGLFTTGLYGLATIAWPYSKAFEREAVLGLCLLLSAYSAFKFRELRQTKWLWAAGASLGFLFFAKIAEIILFPLFAIYIILRFFPFEKRSFDVRPFLRLISFLLPIAFLVGIQALWNYARYGDFTNTGLQVTYGDLSNQFSPSYVIDGLRSFLYLPSKSIFVYSPPLLLLVPGWIAFFREKKSEAVLFAALIISSILFYSFHLDPGQGGWWGPKYLVAITPLAILPISSLFRSNGHRWRALWYSLACLTGLIGVGVQIAGDLVDDRVYTDVTGLGIDLAGAINFLRHGVIDSLLIYLSPIGQLIQVNIYAVVMAIIAVLLLVLTHWNIRQIDNSNRVSLRLSAALLVLVLLVQFTSFITWVVAPYRQVLVAKADTNFIAGNLLLADGMKCYASKMYFSALDGATNYESEAVTRIEPLLPRARGAPKSADAMMDQLERSGDVAIDVDNAIALSDEGSLRITVHGPKSGIATAVSSPIPVLPNSQYELSGWIKAEAISSEGSAVLTLNEDNGSWAKGRNTDIKTIGEGSHDWQPFWGTVTTLPTTRRVIIKAGLAGASGTAWVDRIQIAQITKDNPPSITPSSCR